MKIQDNISNTWQGVVVVDFAVFFFKLFILATFLIAVIKYPKIVNLRKDV